MSTKFVVAILLAEEARAAQLAEALDTSRFQTEVRTTTDALYGVVNYQRVDFVVIDDKLEAFLDGLEVIQRVYNDLLRPKTILLSPEPTRRSIKAQEIGIDLVLPASTEVDTIAQAISDLQAKSQDDQVFIHPLARQLVQETPEIAPLPQLIVKMAMYLSDSSNVVLQDLANDISVDPRVTAELLKLMNSAAMGLRRKFTRVFDAVNYLGVRRTISLVLSSTALQNTENLAQGMSQADRTWYNRRTVMLASSGYAFAKHVAELSPDSSYVLGLFQDLGILVMASHFGDKYTSGLERVRTTPTLRLEVFEQSSFGITHADVGGAILHHWELPPSMVRPVLDHHALRDLEEKPEVERRALHVMNVAEAFANVADGHAAVRYPILQRLLNQYGRGKSEACKVAMKDTIAKATESSKLFTLPIPSPKILQSMVDRLVAQTSATE